MSKMYSAPPDERAVSNAIARGIPEDEEDEEEGEDEQGQDQEDGEEKDGKGEGCSE